MARFIEVNPLDDTVSPSLINTEKILRIREMQSKRVYIIMDYDIHIPVSESYEEVKELIANQKTDKFENMEDRFEKVFKSRLKQMGEEYLKSLIDK